MQATFSLPKGSYTATFTLADGTAITLPVVLSDGASLYASGKAGYSQIASESVAFAQVKPPVITVLAIPAQTVGVVVNFSCAVTGTAPLTYVWTFGDGSLTANTPSVSHTYTTAGTYTVTLTVTDVIGQSSMWSQAVTVNAAAVPLSVTIPAVSGVAGTAVSFSANASGGTSPYGYTWSFGDGTAGTNSPTQSHVYATAGTYPIMLTLMDSTGKTISASSQATITAVTPPPPPSEPLLYDCNLQYVGAFRLPSVTPGSTNMAYTGGTALSYNPANNSLFVVGADRYSVAEISIPATISSSSALTSLTTCAYLQPMTPIVQNIPNDPLTALSATGTQSPPIGGLAVVNGKLVGTAYVGYDSAGAAMVSHFVVSSLNLSTATVSQLYQVGSMNAGYVAGWMCPVPSEWQALLGAPYLTGQGNLSIISRTSSGPAAFGFDPTKLGVTSPVPTTPYLYYPTNNPLGPYEGPSNPIESSTTGYGGMIFVPGTSTILYFGFTGLSYNGYGVATDWGGTNSWKGPISLNNEYAMQVWAYNVNDFAAVKNGTKQPWQVMPYDVWNFAAPITGGAWTIGGVAFDPSTKRVYVSVLNVDDAAAYTFLPIILVYQINTTTIPTLPEIGSLSGEPVVTPNQSSANFDMPIYSGTLAGPVPAGTQVLLTAGNVYDPTGGTIASVTFSSGGTVIGAGTPSTGNGKNWTLLMSTSGLPSGSHGITAQATNSVGLKSNSVSWTLKIQ